LVDIQILSSPDLDVTIGTFLDLFLAGTVENPSAYNSKKKKKERKK